MRTQRFWPILALLLLAAACFGQESTPVLVGGKRWAIVVGAGNYEHYSPLKYSVSDAKKFASKLNGFGFDEDTVRLLVDDAEPRLQPTAGHVLGELAALLADKRLVKSDLFVFYFSGHGVGLPSGDYLIPTDARPETVEQLGVPVKKVIERFVDAGLKNVLIIADACRSGEENKFGAELQKLADKANIAVMLGCEPGQQSREDSSLNASLFSHFLVQALDDPSLRDPASGALWARKVADSVSNATFKFDERNRGRFAQRPTSWTDPTRDVLLGVFGGSAKGDEAVRAFLNSAKGLNKESYAAAMNEYGARLFEADRLPEAIEVYKALDQLGELSPDSRYLLATALMVEDRSLESARVVLGFGNGDEVTNYYRDLAYASAISSAIPVEERLAAAKRAWDQTPTYAVGAIRWMQVKHYGKPEEKAAFLKEFSSSWTLTARQRAYLQGELETLNQDYKAAKAKFAEARKLPGDSPSNHDCDLAEYRAVLLAGVDSETEQFLKRMSKDPARGHYWCGLLAMFYQLNRRFDEMMVAVNGMLTDKTDAMVLWMAVKTAGHRAGEIAAKVAPIAARMPNAWKATLAAAMSDGLNKNGIIGAVQAYLNSKKNVDADADYVFESMVFLHACVQEARVQKQLAENGDQIFYQYGSSEMTPFLKDIGQDFEYWSVYLETMLNGQKHGLLGELVNRFFDPIQHLPDIRNELRSTLSMVYANCGDFERFDAIMRGGGTIGKDRVDIQLFNAAVLASRGKFAEARKALPDPKTVSTVFRSLCEAIDGWLLAEEGKKAEAAAIAKRLEDTREAYTQAALANLYLSLGDEENIEVFCNASRIQKEESFFFLHASALRRYIERIRAKDQKVADLLTFELDSGSPANPLLASLYFGKTPAVEAYAGTFEFSIAGNSDWYEEVKGTLTITILPSGRATGVAELNGAVRSVSGSVDKYGNLRGTVKGGDPEMSLTAKLAPAETYASCEYFTEPGMVVQLLRPNGHRMVWFCKPKLGVKKALFYARSSG